ncbi:MAG: insulinase family protein [Treponema sp.]|nr:insulinase family protein [Treponema sp.]
MKKVNRITRIFLFVFVNTLVLTCISIPGADYAGLGKPADIVPFSSSVITGNLSNGLKYYILENSMPENRAHLGLIVNAGSVLERDDQRGFAHFVEHLAFSDTINFPDLQIQEYLRSLGMRFGPDFNASTSYERTLYHFDVPLEVTDGVKRIPDRALAILNDWTHNVTFKPDFVESEGRVVLEEMRARSGSSERIRKIIFPLIFAGSAYEDREVIGLENVIENATQDQLKEFYDRWYTGDNMAIVFIGDFNGKALEAELINIFNMPAAAKPVNRPVYNLPPPKNGNFHAEIITDPEVTSVSYSIYYKQRYSAKKGTLAYYRETIIDYLISAMLNLRFNEAEVDPDSSAAGSWGGPWYWASNSKFYIMGTSAKTGKAEEALRELLLEKESMRRFGFTESELERAKLNLVSYMQRQLSEKDRRESRIFLRHFASHFLHGEDFADIEWEVEAVNALLPVIGINEIKQAARNYFSANDAMVFLIAPQAEEQELPSKEKIKQIFNETSRAQLTPRQEESVSGELLDTLPQRGPIINEIKDEQTEAVTIVLSNGAKLILKETTNRNNEIILYAMAKGGNVNAPAEAVVSINLLSEMIQVSGLGPYSRTELVNKLAGKQVSMSFWTSNFYRGFQGSSTTQDLQTLFEMLHLFFTQPRLEERAIQSMLDQYRTQLIHQMEDPERAFFNEVSKILTNNHPQFKPLELADIDRVNIAEAETFLQTCLNPADYTFVFTGNINLDTMREYAEKYLGSIPDIISNRFNSIIDPGITRPQNISRTINKGQDERSMVYLAWYVPGENQFNERRNQASGVLFEYLGILLTDEIREKLGGVYGISSNCSVSVIPKGEYSLNVYFVCNPERVDELVNAVIACLNDLINKPLVNDIYNQAKEALLMQHQRSMQRNLHIAQSYANSSVLYNTPLARLNQRPDIIRLVTPREVQDLCRQMLSAGPVRVVLYPE